MRTEGTRFGGLCARIGLLTPVVCSIAAAMLLPACSSPSDSKSEPAYGPTHPGDRLYQCVLAGYDLTGQARLVVYDPTVSEADRGKAPTAGIEATVWLIRNGIGSKLKLRGSANPDGSLLIEDSSGASISGTMSGTSFQGELEIPEANGGLTDAHVAGEDVAAGPSGATRAFCGSYTGSDSGTWNFVVTPSGGISGAFSSGSISGSAAGNHVTLNWGGEVFFTSYSGGATGTINGNSVTGTWNGSGDDGSSVSGSWNGSANCGQGPDTTWSNPADAPPQEAPMLDDPGPTCKCAEVGCCPLPNGASACCVE